MLARRLPITLNGDIAGETPMLVPAFSSRITSNVNEIASYMEDFIVDQILISAYDLYYKNLDSIPTTANLVFLDSGGYEVLADSPTDLSELSQRRKGATKSWDDNTYSQFLKSWGNGPPNYTVAISYDHRTSMEEQVEFAQKLLDVPNILREILLKPPDKQRLLDVAHIMENIELLRSFDIVGMTEKEIGDSMPERMTNIARIRKVMDERNIIRPLHIFGSIDTISTPLYFLSGADIFDGLTWLQYYFFDGFTFYWQHYPVLQKLSQADKEIQFKLYLSNFYYLMGMREQMLKYANDGNFDHFGRHSSLFQYYLNLSISSV